MFDLHSHILYNIPGDDGSLDLSMSLAMLRQAAEAGTGDLFATPHFHRRGICPDWDTITERCPSSSRLRTRLGSPSASTRGPR